MSKNHVLQVVRTGDWLVPYSMIFEMIPDLFIWIKFWRVGWKVEKLQSAFSGRNEF
jgi:hypothetical protein